MKTELELARKVREKYGMEIRDAQPKRVNRDEAAAVRRAIRVESDALVRQGLQAGSLEEISVALAGTMSAVANGCLQFAIEPGISDLVTAAKELIEDARVVIDNGYQLSELDQVAVGSVMLHIVCVGIAGCLSLPYRSALELCNAGYLEGKQPDRALMAEAIARVRAAHAEGAIAAPEAEGTPASATPEQASKGNGEARENNEGGQG